MSNNCGLHYSNDYTMSHVNILQKNFENELEDLKKNSINSLALVAIKESPIKDFLDTLNPFVFLGKRKSKVINSTSENKISLGNPRIVSGLQIFAKFRTDFYRCVLSFKEVEKKVDIVHAQSVKLMIKQNSLNREIALCHDEEKQCREGINHYVSGEDDTEAVIFYSGELNEYVTGLGQLTKSTSKNCQEFSLISSESEKIGEELKNLKSLLNDLNMEKVVTPCIVIPEEPEEESPSLVYKGFQFVVNTSSYLLSCFVAASEASSETPPSISHIKSDQ